ncbi:MAG TPA: maltotransferase domain-containing protein [Acidimicrobiales bacterium]|nr:maltotransferase domain-containing protein [Acidimicrobiales bacterium]
MTPERNASANREPSPKQVRVTTRPPRVVIGHVTPEIDGGRFAVKRIRDRVVTVEADVFADGHDLLSVELRWRLVRSRAWESIGMTPLGNDRYSSSFALGELGRYEFEVRSTVDEFRTWAHALKVRRAAELDLTSDSALGGEILRRAAGRARGGARRALQTAAVAVESGADLEIFDSTALADTVTETIPAAEWVTVGPRFIVVERERAQFSSWYELFPRAAGSDGRPGTLADVERRLGYVAELGFDILYLPPIHPIGTTNRKGVRGGPFAAGDPGSPWAIGSPAGGHTAIDPDLGTIGDFDHLVEAAGALGIEVALDLALQCSPDHPWVREHPDWFRHRPDGTIACAENPPKRYEDVYPLDFGCDDWRALWGACKAIVEFWVGHGVLNFRVDNPHTKPFGFWEWMIAEVQRDHPEVLFLAEAFTRPRVMEHLAKVGFSQSYTYFTWRRTSSELASYFTELTKSGLEEYFRPNAWPNTPDILVWPLAGGSEAAFSIRAVLAATLSANWGIYGPAFEECESDARDDAEEYARSDKFEIRSYSWDSTEGIAPLIARLNAIRHEHPAFWTNATLAFHRSDNPELLVFSKRPEPQESRGTGVLMIVNLDPHFPQTGWVELDPEPLGLPRGSTLELADQLSGEEYRWTPGKNFVSLDPAATPAHVFAVGSVA